MLCEAAGWRVLSPRTNWFVAERGARADSGLDPLTSEDRERLGLGLKAYRIIAPSLPR